MVSIESPWFIKTSSINLILMGICRENVFWCALPLCQRQVINHVSVQTAFGSQGTLSTYNSICISLLSQYFFRFHLNVDDCHIAYNTVSPHTWTNIMSFPGLSLITIIFLGLWLFFKVYSKCAHTQMLWLNWERGKCFRVKKCIILLNSAKCRVCSSVLCCAVP